MPQTLEALLHRTETLSNIRGIVHIMKTLSVLNAAPYEKAAKSIEAYHSTVLDGLAALLHRTGGLRLAPTPLQNAAVVVFGSDHGLCGAYNERLASELETHLAAQEGTRATPYVLCVGAQMHDALLGRGIQAGDVMLTPASADGIGRLAGAIVERLERIRQQDDADAIAVKLAYTRRDDHGQQYPAIEAFMPFSAAMIDQLTKRPWPSRSLPDFSMPSDELFAALVRSHIFAGVFRASAEALVTENATRLSTMHRAEQSVDERLEELKSETRSVRQAEITAELMDVVTGFEARKSLRRRKNLQPSPDRPNR
ncbi:ATP synthase F1, gamma subunit [Ruegeria lacuscaerulensis ITI-1157]|nr:ATP synthase F1, gamma subunit [Ruegeria lacuscaerulensis ITI-1157]SHK12409.1 F-type H+-transporting ATPase subunit gamma [Ruegeria lacuscaerulensis ITI-1157]